MSIHEETVVPASLESEVYFQNLPAISRRSGISRAAVMSFDGVAQQRSVEPNLAEVNKDAPAVVAFADGVSVENREAVLLGVEFAETVASARHDIDTSPVEWLDEYATALRHAGWLTTGGHEYGEYKASSQSLTMEALVLELISAVAGPNAATVISLLNIVIEKFKNDGPLIKLFERNAKRGKTSSFRIMPCVESAQGIPLTYLLAVHCTHLTETGGALFWSWSVSTLQIRRLAKGVQFSQGSYERNKEKVLDYLKGDAASFFEGLKN